MVIDPRLQKASPMHTPIERLTPLNIVLEKAMTSKNQPYVFNNSWILTKTLGNSSRVYEQYDGIQHQSRCHRAPATVLATSMDNSPLSLRLSDVQNRGMLIGGAVVAVGKKEKLLGTNSLSMLLDENQR